MTAPGPNHPTPRVPSTPGFSRKPSQSTPNPRGKQTVKFEIIGGIWSIECIASGPGVRDRRRLIRLYGRGRWRKMKGIAKVRLGDGTLIEAELHWYEAHGIGKKETKFKRPIRTGT